MNVLIKPVIERLKPYGELCYLSYAGSRTYGTHTPVSDVDIQGFFIPNLEYLIGLKQVEQVELNFKNVRGVLIEGTIFSIPKIFKLLSECNPNVLEMLWIRESDMIYKNNVAEKVLANKDLFISKKVKHTFGGYAHAQLQRMKRVNINANLNPLRRQRREEFGYDTKNALHLIRILTMGYEILVEKTLNVWREDREYLKAILAGEYNFEYIQQLADKKFDLLEEAYIKSDLPEKVDYSKIEDLLKTIIIQKIKEQL